MRSPSRGPLVALFLYAAAALAGTGPMAPVDPLTDWKDRRDRSKDAPLSEFRLISYFFARGTLTNQVADPIGLRGVSLGPIGMSGGSTTLISADKPSYFVETRWIPVIEYAPLFVDNYAVLRAQFEIDFMWGRGSNVTQQNEGGAFNVDQVNLQTKNLNVALYPTRNPAQLGIFIGAQSVYDSVFDPTRTPVNDLVKTGYKLMYLASDAVGLSAYFGWKGLGKVQFLPLFSGQPDRAMADSRLKFAFLATADYSYELLPGTLLGLSAWYLRDDTKGTGDLFNGLVVPGPSSLPLPAYTGAARFNIDNAFGGVAWFGFNFQHNLSFNTGPFAASGFAMVNAGRYVTGNPTSRLNSIIDILGLGLNAEAVYNWGRTTNDVVSLEGLYTTGDENLGDGRYTGAFTMNQYGLPGAVWFNHKMMLLFPMTQTVSNYTGAVTDISNQGYGVTAGILSGSWDVVPHKLNLKLAAGAAMSNVDPPGETAGVTPGRFMGLEVNAEVKWHIRYLMTVGLHGGYMFKGSFYDGNPRVAANPWAAFTTFTWYGF